MLRESKRAACTTTSSPKKRYWSSCSGDTTRPGPRRRPALDALDEPVRGRVSRRSRRWASAIARCAVAHRAAHPDVDATRHRVRTPNSIKWTQQRPDRDPARRCIRRCVPPDGAATSAPTSISDVLADRISQTHAAGRARRHCGTTPQPIEVATLLCRIMLEGLASRSPTDAELDQSAGLRRRRRRDQELGRRYRSPTTRPPTSARWRERSSDARATKAPRSATSQPRRESVTARCFG